MMDVESATVGAISIMAGVVYLRSARVASLVEGFDATCEPRGGSSEQRRVQHADGVRARYAVAPRYVIACVAFGVAAAVLVHNISPAVGYAILCFSMVARAVADQIAEERAPRRRSAELGRSRAVNPVLLTWIALAAVSTALLAPYVVGGANRAAALIVAVCVLAMAGVAWRIASAPPLLFGEDLEAEHAVDRATRTIRTGITCVLAAGTVFVFASFVDAAGTARDRAAMIITAFVIWTGIWIWQALYTARLSRMPLAS